MNLSHCRDSRWLRYGFSPFPTRSIPNTFLVFSESHLFAGGAPASARDALRNQSNVTGNSEMAGMKQSRQQ
jgi:hypothetical protein